ncbi:hypothetical protein B0A50_06723 [Salinomyces thailandicus]|uniref:Uncharacterized protein n=1 Tax=Salinomyces thailandicus TaxID=706561 RepID=A0A4U0TQL0_9PEZI|nr:hypothetical protein B0A50_06723 [Salinomyces thailandica]
MAPPSKRRKLSCELERSVMAEAQVEGMATSPAYSHGVEHIPHSHKTAHIPSKPRPVPQRIEEIHVKIQQQAVDSSQGFGIQRRQQGTGATSSEPTSSASSTAVDSASSTTEASSASDSSASSTNTPSLSATGSGSTTASVSTSATDGESSGSSTSATDTTASSSDVSEAAGTATSNISTDTSSGDAASGDAASGTGTLSTSDGTGLGLIGQTPTGATGASSTISATSGSNSTMTSSGSSTSTTGYTSSLSSSLSRNLTTSAIILQGSSTTFTSRTTIDLGSETSRSSTTSTSSSSRSNSLGDVVYLATLRNGNVRTLTRSSSSYATTFANGQVSTISPYSGSLEVSTFSDGAMSTYYQTVMATTDSNGQQSTLTSTAVTTADAGANQADGGGATSASTGSASDETSVTLSNKASDNTPPAGTIAGGVVGGAAGLAVILLIAMLFLRWYRRKAQLGHQALPPNTGMLSGEEVAGASGSPSQPGMAERAGLRPIIGAVPAMFRHQNRSREDSEPEPAERGFTRVSGRKLPSSFSPGMSSPPPTMPLTRTDRNLSSTSFYRDSAGFYGGEGVPDSPVAVRGSADSPPEEMTLSPGPQRQPTVHAGGPYTMMAPTSGPAPTSPRYPGDVSARSPPLTGTAATFDRSETPASLDPNRGSRFTEEV